MSIPSRPSPGRRGPRTEGPATRAAILEAARAEFAERGYGGASLRAVARRAGVDVTLVTYYFRAKDTLFTEAMELPLNPREVLESLGDVPLDRLGATLTRAVLEAWSAAEVQPGIRGVMQLTLTTDAGFGVLREYWMEALVDMLAERLGPLGHGPDEAAYRSALALSHLGGLVVLREVLRLDPLTGRSIDEVVATVGPAVQRYLTEPLPH